MRKTRFLYNIFTYNIVAFATNLIYRFYSSFFVWYLLSFLFAFQSFVIA